MSGESMPHYVILDCDGGSDDAWALLLMLKAHDEKRIYLLGVTICGNGNTTGHNAAYNILRVLKLCNHLEIPVFLGSKKSLLHSSHDCPRKLSFHGQDGFADVLPIDSDISIELVQKQFAVEAIMQMCKERPRQVTIIAIGPLTNIALCYTLYDTVFAESVKDLYIMGGNYQGVGNYTMAAEFNFYVDPEAAQIVLSRSICPVTILPWEPCMDGRFQLSIEWRFKEFGPKTIQHAAIQMLNKVEAAQYLCDNNKTWNPCDALLVTAFLFAKQFILKQSFWHCEINLSGQARGQMVLDHLRETEKNHINARIIEIIDPEFFKIACEWCADFRDVNVTIDELKK